MDSIHWFLDDETDVVPEGDLGGPTRRSRYDDPTHGVLRRIGLAEL